MLVLFYYLSQNPDFSESVRPLMGKLKNSEQMLNFLNDLSEFTKTFSSLHTAPEPETTQKEPPETSGNDEKKEPQSPTAGIADEFIQNILDSYFNKSKKP